MRTFFTTVVATLIGVTISMLVLFGVAVGVVSVAMGGDSAAALKVENNSVLEISMSELITDAPLSVSVVDVILDNGSTPRNVSLLNALLAIERAQSDPSIVAISMRMDGAGGVSLVNASELREALLEFKKSSKKPIYAYAESYSQLRYYLASVADKIFIHPLGGIEWMGVGISSLFYGDLVEELDIRPEIFRPKSNRYKSAIEPFTRSGFSAESREQNQRLVNSLWSSFMGDVALLKGVSTEWLDKMANGEFIITAESAEDYNLVNYVSYVDEYVSALESLGVEVDEGEYNKISLARYSRLAAYERGEMSSQYVKNSIAVIYIDGAIVDGTSDYGDGEQIGSNNVSRQLREAREDDDVKGVVVRVNSPGGSAMASDVIWREMLLLQEVKPLVVSMGGYAASGGYYVSAPADVILASDYTITGSIGVYGLMFDAVSALKNKLHITMDQVGSTKNANFGKMPDGVTPLQRATLQRGVDDVYTAFVSKVASGRNMSGEQVEAVAAGRVWSGVDAERLGLVDQIGGVKHAIMLAMQRSDIASGESCIVEMGDEPDELSVVIDLLMGRMPKIASFLFDVESEFRMLVSMQNSVVAHSPLKVEL